MNHIDDLSAIRGSRGTGSAGPLAAPPNGGRAANAAFGGEL
jgi:hypothetical protein